MITVDEDVFPPDLGRCARNLVDLVVFNQPFAPAADRELCGCG